MDFHSICSIVIIFCLEVISIQTIDNLAKLRYRRELIVHEHVSQQIPPHMWDEDYDDDDNDYTQRQVSNWSLQDALDTSRSQMFRFYLCIENLFMEPEDTCKLDISTLCSDVRSVVHSVLNLCRSDNLACLWKSRYILCSYKYCNYSCRVTEFRVKTNVKNDKTMYKLTRRRRSKQVQCGPFCQLMMCLLMSPAGNQAFLQCMINIKITSWITLPVLSATTTSAEFRYTSSETSVHLGNRTDSPETTSSTTVSEFRSDIQNSEILTAGVATGVVVFVILCVIAILVWIKYRGRRKSRFKISPKIKRKQQESQLSYSHLPKIVVSVIQHISNTNQNTSQNVINQCTNQHTNKTVKGVNRNQEIFHDDVYQTEATPHVECSLPDIRRTIPQNVPGCDGESTYDHLRGAPNSNSSSRRAFKSSSKQTSTCKITEDTYNRLVSNSAGVISTKVNQAKEVNSDISVIGSDGVSPNNSFEDNRLYFILESKGNEYAEISDVTIRENSESNHIYFILETTDDTDKK